MASLFDKFSSQENLKKAYRHVLNELAHSALSINPIHHPAITAINDMGDNFFIALEQQIRDGNYKPEKPFFVYIPKDNFGIRPVCIPSMTDRIVYQAIFNQGILGHKIDGQLSDKTCFANRVNDDELSDNFLSPYFLGWDAFCVQQKRAFSKGYCWKLEVDIQQYYEHISVRKLIEKLKREFGIKDEKILHILQEQLCTWGECDEIERGIPQGPDGSSVLSNVYLAALDAFAEKDLVGSQVQYFRYADDICLMGKTKRDVLSAIEKIIRFLRPHNLTVNEKTKVTELEDDTPIRQMRFFSEYEDYTEEIPEDEFTRIQKKIPRLVKDISDGKKIEKAEISEFKYFLKADTSYSPIFMDALVEIIPLKPSLTVPIVQYVAEGRKILNPANKIITDAFLWKIYKGPELTEWSRFWIFKLLISQDDVSIKGIAAEAEKIVSSKESTIFKVAAFYYLIIHSKEITVEDVKEAMKNCETAVEKSIYAFFLLNAFATARTSVIKGLIEKLLDDPSHELNLMGAYLFKNKPKVKVDEPESVFSGYLLGKKPKKRKGDPKREVSKVYLVREENLIPISSPASILGVDRTPKKKRNIIELTFPEIVQWDKVVMKLKEGLEDVEIWYDGSHIKTANYIELGFSATKKHHKPDRRWSLLRILAVLQSTDIKQATPAKLVPMLAATSGRTTGIANVHQTKRLLSKALRACFKTSDDPFVSKNGQRYYEPVFTISPEPELRDSALRKQGGKLNDNHDYSKD